MSSSEDISRWNAIAETFSNTVGQPSDSFARRAEPAFHRAIPSPAGQRILDVGCGSGWLGAQYAKRGAEIVGVDGSEQLIGQARERHPSSEWLVHDFNAGLLSGIGEFHAAIAHMLLMDLPRLSPLLKDLRKALRPGGVFIASILHPSFFNQQIQEAEGAWSRKVTNYLTPQRWWIDSFGGHWHYHRPLEFYVKELVGAGFVITDVAEPRSLPSEHIDEAEWSDYQRWFADIPTMLVITAERP